MKELKDILKAYREAKRPTALATVVETSGSTYRKPGARMLILSDGKAIGCISGGCLDKDVIQQALEVIATGKTRLVSYDATSDEDVVMGMGLGCKGVIHILLERLMPPDGVRTRATVLDFVGESLHSRNAVAIATVFRASGPSNLEVGDRAMLGNGNHSGPPDRDAGPLLRYAIGSLRHGRCGVMHHESERGVTDVLVEKFTPPPTLVIFGSGQDAVPLAHLGARLGLRTVVVSPHEALMTRERFPDAEELFVAHPDNLREPLPLDENSVAVIMSHNYMIDRAWLKLALPLSLRYVGLMGPRKRAEQILDELEQEGFVPNEDQLSALYNPAGLDIGAEGPDQIALAILAEVQAVLTGKAGGYLRNAKGRIHSPKGKQLQTGPEQCPTLA